MWAKISALSFEEFVGMVADDPDNKRNMKAFHSEIINDHEALRKEEEKHKEVEIIRKSNDGIVQLNYCK